MEVGRDSAHMALSGNGCRGHMALSALTTKRQPLPMLTKQFLSGMTRDRHLKMIIMMRHSYRMYRSDCIHPTIALPDHYTSTVSS